ncbi:NAD(P)-dependent oxidoreductase [Vogesella oryzae]|uniref:NAD(P)-dependent oxidoreductase n=1 Tax=Vogesella oryzae TaxID=1735285 RepID=UPI002483A176|nr:NAD(P)-dependent oxidoreductase [Vogesella oryzae]
MRIGFIGLGLMGVPMCQRLLQAGAALMVWNRTPGKAETLCLQGAVLAHSVAELVANCDVVMLCVSDTEAVRQLLFADDGIAANARAGQLLLDFSSIAPAATRDMAARLLAQTGMRWVDAPVSGGVRGAESGQLVIMAGGEEADIDVMRPLLAHLGQRVTRMGPVGAGQVTKVCNQLIVASNAMLIAETVHLAAAAGVDAGKLAPALAGGFADSLPFQILAPRMAAHDFALVQWRVATLLKDLGNALALGQESGSDLPLATLAQQLMQQHAALDGNGQRDLASIIELYDGDGSC